MTAFLGGQAEYHALRAEAAIGAAASSVEVVRHVLRGADHGLGVFSDEPHLTEEAVATTAGFLSKRL